MAFEILARIGANVTGLLGGLKRAESAATQFSGTLKRQIASAFGVGAIVAFERSVIRSFSNIADSAERTRLSLAGVQQVTNILRDAGMEFSAIEPLINNLEKAADAAASGKEEFKDMADLFRGMGINAASFSLQEPEAQLRQFSQALQAFDEKGQANILREVVGQKVGPKMLSVLGQLAGGAGTDNISPDEIVKEYESAGNRMEKAWDGFRKSVARDSILLRGWNRVVRDSFIVSLFAGRPEIPQGEQDGSAPIAPGVFRRVKAERDLVIEREVNDRELPSPSFSTYRPEISSLQRIGAQIDGESPDLQRKQLEKLIAIEQHTRKTATNATSDPID